MTTNFEELEKLATLKEQWILSQEEFETEKKKILNRNTYVEYQIIQQEEKQSKSKNETGNTETQFGFIYVTFFIWLFVLGFILNEIWFSDDMITIIIWIFFWIWIIVIYQLEDKSLKK